MQASSRRCLGTTLGQYKLERGTKQFHSQGGKKTTQGWVGITLSGSVDCTQETLKTEKHPALPS